VVVVEQSLSVALSLAQRAVFIERGRIHYEGPTEELLERDDLARAIFLGR
jgi:ABC-type branched-subunit amino acid transport system ATPase component